VIGESRERRRGEGRRRRRTTTADDDLPPFGADLGQADDADADDDDDACCCCCCYRCAAGGIIIGRRHCIILYIRGLGGLRTAVCGNNRLPPFLLLSSLWASVGRRPYCALS
jgi:hypothetical protein